MTPKQMIWLLRRNGFRLVPGGSGSHRKLVNPETGIIIIVPYHAKDLKKGLEQAILRQAGLKQK